MEQPESGKVSSRDGAVDILELMAILWRGRWTIVLASTVVALASVFWLSFQKDVYRIDAVINSADSLMVESLQPSLLKSLVGTGQEGQYKNAQQQYQVRNVESGRLFSIVFDSLSGGVALKAFWEQKNSAVLSLDDVKSEDFQRYMKLMERFSWSKVEASKGGGVQLVLTARSPSQGVEELSQFISFLNLLAIEKAMVRVRGGLEAKLDALNRDYDVVVEQEMVRVSDRLIQLQEAVAIAGALGFSETPYNKVTGVELSILDNRLYLLGERALNAEIEMLKRRNSPEAFVPILRGMQVWKKQITQDLERYSSTAELSAFSVVRGATSTPYPVKPRRVMVVIAAVFFGGVVGVVLVLLRQGVRVYRSRY